MPTAMIWGAGGGMGRALLQHLSDANWTTLAVTHQPTTLNKLTPHVFDANTADPYAVQLVMASASQVVETVDLWVYTPGDIVKQSVAEMKPDTWLRIVDANLTGAYLSTHYSLPLLSENAHLIYIGAVTERLQLPGLSAYAAAKHGLQAFTTALSKEERKRTITLLRPGAVDTPFWDKMPLNLPKNALSPADVAQRVLKIYQEGEKGVVDM